MDGARQLLLVGLGGFIGAVARWAIGGWVHRALPHATFPRRNPARERDRLLESGLWPIWPSRPQLDPEVRVFAMIGVLGGFAVTARRTPS